MSEQHLQVIRIIDGTTVDGPGFRTSIYLAGCEHHCPGCHNPHTWPHNAGEPVAISQLLQRIDANDMDVTLTGGDPLFQMPALLTLAQAIHDRRRNLWLYTGFTLEQILASPTLSPILPYIDVLVDGPFISALRDTTLIFRGSSNQRLLDIPTTLSTSRPTPWSPPF